MLKSLKRQGRQLSSGLRLAIGKTSANEKACEINNDAFRRLIEVAPEGVTIHQGLVYANQAAAEQYGASDPEEILGRDVRDFIAPADRERLAARVKQFFDEGGQGRLTRFQRLCLDGTILDVETVAVAIKWRGRPAILSLVRDITARVLAEERLKGLLSTGMHWLWETDAEHRFSWFSEEPSRISRSYAANLGKTRWEMVGASPDHAFWREHVATLNANQPFDNFEYWNLLPDGSKICVSISGTPIVDAKGVFLGYRGISGDITARVQAKARLEGFLETATNWLWETDVEHRFTILVRYPQRHRHETI